MRDINFAEIYESDFQKIHELFEETKVILRKIELHHPEAATIIPKDQLLFAGLHLSRAVNASLSFKTFHQFNYEITEAKSHCQKAANYACKEGIKACLAKIDLFTLGFSNTVLLGIVPDFSAIKKRARLAHTFILEEETNCLVNPPEYKSHYDVVFDDLQTLNALHDELKKKQKERRRNALLAIIGAFGALLGGAGALYKAVSEDSSKAQTNSHEIRSPTVAEKVVSNAPKNAPSSTPAASPP